MTFRTLIRRSLRFHWRAHLGVVLGATIGSAALIGALVVGDSVRESLRNDALRRTAGVAFAISPPDRFFRDDLRFDLESPFDQNVSEQWLSSASNRWFYRQPIMTTGLRLVGTTARDDGEARAAGVQILSLGPGLDQFASLPRLTNFSDDDVILNEALAQQLHAKPGDLLILRVSKPSALSMESPVSPRAHASVSMRLRVHSIMEPWTIGDFSLSTRQLPSFNAFVRADRLQRDLVLGGRANLLLVGHFEKSIEPPGKHMVIASIEKLWRRFMPARGRSSGEDLIDERIHPDEAAKFLQAGLSNSWRLQDTESLLVALPLNNRCELRSSRVFIDPPIILAASASATNGQALLTYLATLLHAGTNTTPYSMVTAAGAPWTPADLKNDEIVVSQWLADDLHVKPGDEISMSYFLPESGAKLEEATNMFRVRSIVPMEMPWADRTLMPDFPGIEKAESTSEWDAGFPLTYKVRPKDDEYWKQHRGTPKAFITLAAGQKMWGNRFGNLTAIRFPIPTNSAPEKFRDELEKGILANLKPEELGLRFEPVREQALKAAQESQDFGGLFLGFSFFLIAAALLLMGLLFQLGLEQRAPEIGTFLALGFTPKQVRNLLLREGVALALIGGVLGTIGGLFYARAMLHGLTTIWRDAVGASALGFHFTGQTLAIGLLASVVVSAATIWLSLRKFVKRPARALLVGDIGNDDANVRSLNSKVVGAAAWLMGLSLVGFAVAKGDTTNAGIFFGAGALVLIGGLSFTSAWFKQSGGDPVAKSTGGLITLGSLAVRGSARRRKRSLSTVAMLACGTFLIVSIGVFRLDANRDATNKTSGTGGFALIGNTTMPVVQDLNSQAGREFFALNEQDLNNVSFVPFRVREGDEASCLNLNAAQRPRLLGVKPALLESRFGFAKGKGWADLRTALDAPNSALEIPAIGDANSIQWAMKKKVGDTIDYVDERGQPFKVRIVGGVANSILQGQLIIDEAEFVKRFPGESGYRTFLIDAPSNTVSQVSATLSRAMQDVGLELTPAADRLAQFNAVQNTYLGTFQVLGGLGLLLGSVGLGIVVLRNVLERRGELALLIAVGFRKRQVQHLLLMENGVLLAAGLALGLIAATVAVMPALLSSNAQLPVTSLTLTLGAVLINGAIWTWAATKLALRGDLLAALRNE